MKSDSLSFKAYAEIRKKILSIQIPPATRLKENFWATKIGVSRIAIREALTRLLGEGLVSMGAKGGYFVTTLSKEDVMDIRELREILEIGALRLIGNKLTKEQLLRLEKICNDFTSMVKQGYYSGANEADLKFHETLIEFTKNEKLIQSYANSHIPLFHEKLTKNATTEDDYLLTDKEHRAIVAALKAKNQLLAEKKLSEHFARGAKLMALEN